MRIYIFFVCINLVLFLSLSVQADEPERQWLARYNGPTGGTDQAKALAIDNGGNVYVTGYSWGIYYDYATIKYDPKGNQLWVARYNGPADGNDCACAITIDKKGKIYVTGYSYSNGTDYDYATIKYNADGNEVWVARYNRTDRDDRVISDNYSYRSTRIKITGWV